MKKITITGLLLLTSFSLFADANTISFKDYPFCSDLVELEYYDLYVRYDCDADSEWNAADICADLAENDRVEEYQRYCVGKDDITLN